MNTKQYFILTLSCVALATRIVAMEEIPDTEKTSRSKIIVLYGPVSTGKSSLCQALLKHDTTWKEVSDDAVFFEQTAACWKEDFPAEFANIEAAIDTCNINHAIMRNQIMFRTDKSESQRALSKQAIAAIQQKTTSRWNKKLGEAIIQKIMESAKTHNVIVDAWFLKPDHIKQIAKEHDVIQVASYCSLLSVIKRTIQRNANALINGKDISSIRNLRQAYNSFLHNYDFSPKAQGSIGFEDKTSILHALDLIEFGLQDPPVRGEFSPKEFEQSKQELLAKFTSDKAHVISKYNVDATIITDQQSPIESVQTILELVQTKEPSKVDHLAEQRKLLTQLAQERANRSTQQNNSAVQPATK